MNLGLKFYQLVRHFGPTWVVRRALYAQRIRCGAMRAKLPAKSWRDVPLAGWLRNPAMAEAVDYVQFRQQHDSKFLIAPGRVRDHHDVLAQWDAEPAQATQLADELGRGVMRFFDHAATTVGMPPDWHRHASTGERLPNNCHWTQIDDFRFGDIKLVWEPSRFASAFLLVRAYARTGEDRLAELFWTLVESWRAENPPQQGANWKCGQEVGLRVLAWCFGFHGFLSNPVSTPERVAGLAQMMAVSAQRIEANLGYALSQRNNHGISEAAALWTVGCLFPEFQQAAHWARLGRRLLERQAAELIYQDGTFSQHSVNYHRVMLHVYLWSMRLGELQGQPFSWGLYERIKSAGRFLHQIQDEQTGGVPNYGHNDGALVLPLSNCDYPDFRPVVQATQYLTTRTRCFDAGPWDEDLFWLFGREALDVPVQPQPRTDLKAEDGGYYTLRSAAGFVMTRAPRFRHRPAQADALHVDLWWRGQNIAVDAGTYSYNAPPPWDLALADTACHNTVSVDGRDQMERAGRFLWLPWLRGDVRHEARFAEGSMSYWEAEHDGYRRLAGRVGHCRGVLRIGEDHWVIFDRLCGRRNHEFRLHWLLADFPHQWLAHERRLQLQTAAGNYGLNLACSVPDADVSVVRADAANPRGWHSRYYGQREPAISVCMTARGDCADFWTVFGPAACQIQLAGQHVQIAGDTWHVSLTTSRHWAKSSSMLTSATLSGIANGRLAAA
jgi:hypothetical protein